MSKVAEHVIVVYKADVYRFTEYRRQYEHYGYFQCVQPELRELGIIGFFIGTRDDESPWNKEETSYPYEVMV